jgi:hypothetical protein
MAYELSNPKKVKPFFSKDLSLMERSPLTFYKGAFIVMTIINISLLIWMNA